DLLAGARVEAALGEGPRQGGVGAGQRLRAEQGGGQKRGAHQRFPLRKSRPELGSPASTSPPARRACSAPGSARAGSLFSRSPIARPPGVWAKPLAPARP